MAGAREASCGGPRKEGGRGRFEPQYWAQLWDLAGGVHLNIQGETWYEPPTWPEQPDEQAKMLHFEVEVDDLEAAVATALGARGTEAPWQPPDRDRERIRVMLDPAGHPLCLFPPRRVGHPYTARSDATPARPATR